MFFNGAQCDIYIGKGAGKKLLSDIRNAKSSVKIVSPYLSPFLISELIAFSKRNLKVELITTDTIEDFFKGKDKNIHQLIKQHRETDQIALEKREKWKRTVKILTYSNVVLFLVLIGFGYYLKDLKVALGFIPVFVIYVIIKWFKRSIKRKRIYSYWYSQLFPFKVYQSPKTSELSDTFIHGKIYLIDDQIAYLGSLNFTASGTKHNYETRIRTTDPKAIREIKKEIFQLMNHTHLPERDIQVWGQQLYWEPIN